MEIYSQKAPTKSNSAKAIILLFIVLAATCILMFCANYLPYTGIITLAVLFAAACAVYRILNNTTFDITYTLYADRLVFMRKYGYLAWENEVFPTDEAKFFPDRIEYNKKTYAFYPDKKMQELLNM